MNHYSSTYKDARNFNGQHYETARETAIAIELLAQRTDFGVVFHETMQNYSSYTQLWSLVGAQQQQCHDIENSRDIDRSVEQQQKKKYIDVW